MAAMLTTFLKHGSNGFLCLCILAVLALWLIAASPASSAWIVVGALLFYLSEYSWHRFAFHAPPARWAWLRKMQHRLHYDHHVEPNRLDLLFLPLWFLVPNLIITGALVDLVLGDARLLPVLVGIMLAILHYEWMHYLAHIPYQPRTHFGRWMKQYHLRHHFISEKLWFGVSNPSLDVLYGTYRAPKTVEKSQTTRKLYS
jgi:sterol desaturase/sphingolipid hydroxylase (fatty acid hydroxylase superfamily)